MIAGSYSAKIFLQRYHRSSRFRNFACSQIQQPSLVVSKEDTVYLVRSKYPTILQDLTGKKKDSAMSAQIPYHQRKSQRLQKQASSSHQSPLFGIETMATTEGNPSAQGRTDLANVARNLRRMKRRLLMQAMQVQPSATSGKEQVPQVPVALPAKSSARTNKRRTSRVSKKKVAGSNKEHNRNTSCFF